MRIAIAFGRDFASGFRQQKTAETAMSLVRAQTFVCPSAFGHQSPVC